MCPSFASLHQHGQTRRTPAEDLSFKRALRVMGDLYASAVGTIVLQMKAVPPRPQRFDGAVVLFDPPAQLNTMVDNAMGDPVRDLLRNYNAMMRMPRSTVMPVTDDQLMAQSTAGTVDRQKSVLDYLRKAFDQQINGFDQQATSSKRGGRKGGRLDVQISSFARENGFIVVRFANRETALAAVRAGPPPDLCAALDLFYNEQSYDGGWESGDGSRNADDGRGW